MATITAPTAASGNDAGRNQGGRRRRRWPWALVAVGGLLGGTALVWDAVAVPRLVKYPDDVNTSLSYAGTFTLFVDPTTAAPLPEPEQRPLTVDRTVQVVESDADLAVVRETVVIKVEGLRDSTQVHQYVIDRRTMANVADPRAWAFTEANVLDRTGTYRISFPMHFRPGTVFTGFKDETATRYPIPSDDAVLAERVHGVEQVPLRASGTNQVLTPSYVEALSATVPLPPELTLDALKPSLKAKGVDVDATLAALLPVISPADLEVLAGLAATPIRLQYVTSFAGTTTADPLTGATVDVREIDETVGALPAPDALPPLLDVLGRYTEVPEVAAAVQGLEAMGSSPIPLFEHRYALTPASLDEVSQDIAAAGRQVRLAETWVPWGLGIVGVTLMLAGLGLVLVRRPVTPSGPTAGEPVDAHTTELSDHDLASLLVQHEVVVPSADGRAVPVPGSR